MKTCVGFCAVCVRVAEIRLGPSVIRSILSYKNGFICKLSNCYLHRRVGVPTLTVAWMKSWYRLVRAKGMAALIQGWFANSFSRVPPTQALFSWLDNSLRCKPCT